MAPSLAPQINTASLLWQTFFEWFGSLRFSR